MASDTASTAPVSGIDTGILLEAGTNEAEVLVFRVADRRFGVNVAKVREVLPIEDVTDIPKSHVAIDGLVSIRDTVVPMVNLHRYLYADIPIDEEDEENNSLILLEFNGQQVAFRVARVERIHRVSWKDTLQAPTLGDSAVPVTSILRQEEGLVPLLDFESITADIGVGNRADLDSHTISSSTVDRGQMPIVFADDSRMISEMIHDSLEESGYTNHHGFADGQDAWTYLKGLAQGATPESIAQQVAAIVSDIEMPRMDGLNLTKMIRQDPVLKNVPVVLFSSIASLDNQKKGEQVGATAQVSKPDYSSLITTLDRCLEDDDA